MYPIIFCIHTHLIEEEETVVLFGVCVSVCAICKTNWFFESGFQVVAAAGYRYFLFFI